MSKQSEAKAAQGYVDKIKQLPVCMSCVHFALDTVAREDVFGATFMRERNLRCTLGGFAVKKMGTCRKFQADLAKE